jgi:hypothetical protein
LQYSVARQANHPRSEHSTQVLPPYQLLAWRWKTRVLDSA